MPLALALVSLVFVRSSDLNVHMNILFAGSKSGETTYERKADGSVKSSTSLKLGTVDIRSDLVGSFVGDLLQKFTCQVHQPGLAMNLTLDGKKVTAVANSKLQAIDLPTPNPVISGSLHPQFTAFLLKATDFEKKEPQKFLSFIVDAGAITNVTVTPQETKAIEGKGAVKVYKVSFGAVEAQYAMDVSGKVVGVDVRSQKLKMVADGWEKLYDDPLAKYPELSQPTFETKVETGVRAQMHDGVGLVADVRRPVGDGPFPVILVRTPYGRFAESLMGDFYAKRGYIFVSQDCRGRGDSEGDWDPFVHEQTDGYESVNWASKLEGSNGKVGMIGASYAGYVQWAAAVENPGPLKCIVPQVSPPDAMHNIPYDNGTFFLYPDLWWARIVRQKQADLRSINQGFKNVEGFDVLPLSKLDDAVLGKDIPFFDKWLERETIDDWVGFDYQRLLKRVKIPVLHISGWQDGDEMGTQLNYASLLAEGHPNQWLIYGPWVHAFNTTTQVADVEYGPQSLLELDSLYLRWFDTWLKGKDVGIGKVPKVKAFATGTNRWVEMKSWPDETISKKQTLYLSSNMTLDYRQPDKMEPVTKTYDPSKEKAKDSFVKWQKMKETTVIDKPTLMFQSSPYAESTMIGGPISLDLVISTTADDTDVFAYLVDIDSKGVARQICQPGKLRLSYRRGFTQRVAMSANKPESVYIDLWDVLHEFQVGHRIGLVIEYSMFPVYARNLGTIEPIATATKMVPQVNTVFSEIGKISKLNYRIVKP